MKDHKKQRDNRRQRFYSQDDRSLKSGRNYEGYRDPTACQAIQNLEREEARKAAKRTSK
ncbi:MAG: hypothetical protein IIZ39_03560 [Blautia sp.]|nr:hypothetical protein [Blautia sp.]